MKAGILNVSGYAGAELVRILRGHPEAEIASITGRSAAGKKLGEVFPHLAAVDMTISPELDASVDIVFSALPHTASAEAVKPLMERGVRTIDISADFRLKSPIEYREWYKVEHPCPEYLEEAVYGLPELHRSEIASARLVANSGCYSTAAILALAPAVRAGIVEPGIVVDAKSGVSGAGRGTSLATHFSEINESVKAYSVAGHRHLPEVVNELAALDGTHDLKITMLTHLIPITRGILASCYAPLREGALDKSALGDGVRDVYEEFYKDHPFVQVVDTPPTTKQTLGSNTCAVYPTVDVRTHRLIVISCIDNLVKGAAGQAVQNMNLMLGFPEDEGLTDLALYP